MLIQWGYLFRPQQYWLQLLNADLQSLNCYRLDSEYYLIEARLHELKFERHTGETVEQCLRRSQTMFPDLPLSDLDQITQLHYRHRFDPNGLMAPKRKQLHDLSHQIVELLDCDDKNSD